MWPIAFKTFVSSRYCSSDWSYHAIYMPPSNPTFSLPLSLVSPYVKMLFIWISPPYLIARITLQKRRTTFNHIPTSASSSVSSSLSSLTNHLWSNQTNHQHSFVRSLYSENCSPHTHTSTGLEGQQNVNTQKNHIFFYTVITYCCHTLTHKHTPHACWVSSWPGCVSPLTRTVSGCSSNQCSYAALFVFSSILF